MSQFKTFLTAPDPFLCVVLFCIFETHTSLLPFCSTVSPTAAVHCSANTQLDHIHYANTHTLERFHCEYIFLSVVVVKGHRMMGKVISIVTYWITTVIFRICVRAIVHTKSTAIHTFFQSLVMQPVLIHCQYWSV